jgi:arylsulfatase A-like enzyme
LLEALRGKGELERTVVIFTADHGESLGEQDYWFEHGMYAYEATNHVPLVVRFPEHSNEHDALGASNVRKGTLSLCDVAPTLTDWLGLPELFAASPDAIRGISRRSLFSADDPSDHPVYYEKVERPDLDGAVQWKGVRIGKWKVLQRFAIREKGARARKLHPEELQTLDGFDRAAGRERVDLEREYYNLANDPLEARIVEKTADLDELNASRARNEALDRFMSADSHLLDAADVLRKQREELERRDPQAIDELNKLGYK